VRVVLDACVPRKFGKLLISHEVTTAHALGLGALDDRPLLDALEGKCDALVTVDRRMSEQQRLRGRSFALVVVCARSNRLADLAPLAAATLSQLALAQSGEVRVVSGRGDR
jgi:predicted nuclease of predicted toxin-antitoxin system